MYQILCGGLRPIIIQKRILKDVRGSSTGPISKKICFSIFGFHKPEFDVEIWIFSGHDFVSYKDYGWIRAKIIQVLNSAVIMLLMKCVCMGYYAVIFYFIILFREFLLTKRLVFWSMNGFKIENPLYLLVVNKCPIRLRHFKTICIFCLIQ